MLDITVATKQTLSGVERKLNIQNILVTLVIVYGKC